MDPTHAVAVACQHQDTIVQVLAYIGGITPLASIVAWLSARWNHMPAGAQAILQLLAGNPLHALLGEPQKPAAPTPPAQPSAPPPIAPPAATASPPAPAG